MPALPTIVQQANAAPKPPPISREQLRERATAKAAELSAKAAPAEEKKEPAVEEKPKEAAKVEPGTEPADPAKAAAPEEKKEPPKPEKPTSDAILAFEREKAKFQAQQAAKEASFKKQMDEFSAKQKEAAADDELKKTDKYAWAEKHGIDLKGYNERALNGGNKTPAEEAREAAAAEVAAFKKQMEEERAKERGERERERQSDALRKWEAEIDTEIAAEPYALLRSPPGQLIGSKGLIRQVIYEQASNDIKEAVSAGISEEDARRSVKPLTNKEAADRVKAYLEKLRVAFLEFDKATLPAKQSAAQQAPKVTQGGNADSPRTLDPDSLAAPPPDTDEDAGLSREERRARRRARLLAKQG